MFFITLCHVTGKQLKMLYRETVHQNRMKLVATEKALNSQNCLNVNVFQQLRSLTQYYIELAKAGFLLSAT